MALTHSFALLAVLFAAAACDGASNAAYFPSRKLQFLGGGGGVVSNVVETVSDAASSAPQSFLDARESVSNAVSDAPQSFSDARESVTGALEDGLQGLEDSLGENLEALGDVGECLRDPEECREKLEEVEDCFDDPFGCASNKIKELLPDIDITTCDTDEVKADFTAGGWRAYYGPRLWDSKSVATVVGFFFPGTAAAAAETFVREIEKQSKELVEKLNEALADVEDAASENLEQVMNTIFKKLMRLDLSLETFESPNLDLKLQFLRVECKNSVGTVEIPSEGYIRWGFGWRFKGASVSIGEGLPLDLESTASLEDFNPERG